MAKGMAYGKLKGGAEVSRGITEVTGKTKAEVLKKLNGRMRSNSLVKSGDFEKTLGVLVILAKETIINYWYCEDVKIGKYKTSKIKYGPYVELGKIPALVKDAMRLTYKFEDRLVVKRADE